MVTPPIGGGGVSQQVGSYLPPYARPLWGRAIAKRSKLGGRLDSRYFYAKIKAVSNQPKKGNNTKRYKKKITLQNCPINIVAGITS